VNSIFIPDFPLTLPLSPDSGGEGGVRGDSHDAFYATFRYIQSIPDFQDMQRGKANLNGTDPELGNIHLAIGIKTVAN